MAASQIELLLSNLFLVFQEYISNPLLLDPSEVSLDGRSPSLGTEHLRGHKVSFTPLGCVLVSESTATNSFIFESIVLHLGP